MPRLTAALTVVAIASGVFLGACAAEQRETASNPGVTLQPLQAAEAYATVAQDMEIAGDIPSAIRNYKLAREADPVAYQWVAHRLAILHAEQGDMVAADIEFRRAWRLNPNDPAVIADWAMVFEEG